VYLHCGVEINLAISEWAFEVGGTALQLRQTQCDDILADGMFYRAKLCVSSVVNSRMRAGVRECFGASGWKSQLAAKDFLASRKYAYEDAEAPKGERVAADNDSCLITALKRRDRSAWSAAVDRHLHELYGFVFHLVGGDRGLAEELNQETWLEAIDGIDRCDAVRGSFRNWLFGIARNRVALHYRRRDVTGNTKSLGSQFEAADELGDVSILPEDVLERVEQRSVVRAAMLVLPADRRKILIWKYVEGLSVKAIAIRTERTAKAVESLLNRAREQMRDILREYMMPRDDGRKRKEMSHE
jgi:RNA polymerase sigma-70 factor, ECF subfamily